MKRENLTEIYVIENTTVIRFRGGQARWKKRELKMSRNFRKSLKTHVEQMSAFRLSIILMKTNELNSSFHYVDDNKGIS